MSNKSTGNVFFASLIMLVLTACATNQLESLPDDVSTVEPGYEYVIGPGDVLEIFVWGYEDLTVSLPVRPDGKITTRLVEDMVAAGKTPTQLARDIEVKYVDFVNNPIVSISVSGFVGSASQQVKVVGAGSEAKSIPYRSGMSLLDLMIELGGIGEFAVGNKSVLVRKVEGERKSFRLRLGDLMNKGDLSVDINLRPGDIVIVPESWF